MNANSKEQNGNQERHVHKPPLTTVLCDPWVFSFISVH